MANISTPFGFRPVRHLTGAPYNGQGQIYELPVGDATTVMVGDLVKLLSGTPTDNYKVVTRYGTSGEITSGLIVGSVMGFVIPTNAGSMALDTPIYRVASTKRYVFVADSPDLIFEVQDGASTATPITATGLNCGVQAAAGSTVTGLSNMTTGATTATTTNTLPLSIYGFVSRPDNTVGSAFQKMLVRINQHQWTAGQTGV